jgi:hypothetical protein
MALPVAHYDHHVNQTGHTLFDNRWPPKDVFPEFNERVSQQHYQAFIAHANDHGMKPYIEDSKELLNVCAECCATILCPLGGCFYLCHVRQERQRFRDELEEHLKQCMEPFQQQVLQYANIRGDTGIHKVVKSTGGTDNDDDGRKTYYYPYIEFRRLDSGGPLPASAPRPEPGPAAQPQ